MLLVLLFARLFGTITFIILIILIIIIIIIFIIIPFTAAFTNCFYCDILVYIFMRIFLSPLNQRLLNLCNIFSFFGSPNLGGGKGICGKKYRGENKYDFHFK